MTTEEIFHAALELSSGRERDAFLDVACREQPDVRREVESLLVAHETDGEFLSGPLIVLPPSTSASINRSPDALRLPRLQPDAQLGRYRIARLLGAGGMGEVYLAHDPQLNRDVAIKVLFPSHAADQQWLSRFHREARAASAVNHPGILTIYEIGQADGIDFIASEFVQGRTLRKRMNEGLMPVTGVIGLAQQIASALAAAHSAGVVHRDLKPENVMVRDDGLIKVLDFGLARSPEGWLSSALSGLHGQASQPGLIAGTLSYMSPEQARGQRVDHRSDLFSLGILLAELLTGQHPFPGATPGDVLVAILDRAPHLPPRINGLAPDRLLKLIDRMLTREIDLRISSAAEIAQELRRLQDEPARARGALSAVVDTRDTSSLSVESISPQQPELSSSASRIPEVRYTTSSDVNIAYQVFGSGPVDLVFVMGWVSHLEWFWREPSFARFLRDIGTFARVILFDKRGTGLSDRVPVHQLPTLEQRMDDVRAVMEAADSQRAVLCGVSEGGPMCALFAATYPEKTIALVMIGSYARRLWSEDYPFGVREEHRSAFLDEIRRNWGGPVGIEDRAPSMARNETFRDWWATYLRMGASPGAALALTQMNAQIDIRPILPLIRVPTLVIHRTADRCLKIEEGRYLAERIPGAVFCELPGDDHLPFVGRQSEIVDAIRNFLTGALDVEHSERVLATVVAGALVLPENTDRSSHELTERFQSCVREEIALFRGGGVVFSRDGFLATFEGPTRAIRCALGIVRTVHRLGWSLRAGVHIGECDVSESSIGGTAALQARAISELASPRDVVVSGTVKDLVAGSGLQFVEFDSRTLSNDIPELRLFHVPG